MSIERLHVKFQEQINPDAERLVPVTVVTLVLDVMVDNLDCEVVVEVPVLVEDDKLMMTRCIELEANNEVNKCYLLDEFACVDEVAREIEAALPVVEVTDNELLIVDLEVVPLNVVAKLESVEEPL